VTLRIAQANGQVVCDLEWLTLFWSIQLHFCFDGYSILVADGEVPNGARSRSLRVCDLLMHLMRVAV
jgi:hypothetical protein